MYNGRILVIDSQYTIVKDTYATLNGMTSISQETIKAMSGENIRDIIKKKKMLEMAVPITNEDKSEILGVILFLFIHLGYSENL